MSTLSPDRWHEVSPYLDQALSLPEPERAIWFESFCLERPDLAGLLQELLNEHSALAREHFLEQGPIGPRNEPSLPGQTVGAYRLISPIGQGGMGSVWLAERNDGRFERRVAVKFLNFAVAAQGAERFKREGSILGRLSDPHIAELIDAGVTAKGEPYLVLEHVEGAHIDEYCDLHTLDVDARVSLFLDVLGAVAQAHAHLVVHRDIKPSNVLVRNDGQVKLLDFGIAKLLADDTNPASATLLTIEGGGALTPQFAAPEQVTSGAITTATDVYSLGVLLYVLLSGHHPAGPGPHSSADLVKSISETDAPLASQAVAAANDTGSAEKRGAAPDKLCRRLRGELDTILAKALKKKPGERYTSVAAFADDLRRYLRHEPITARPDTVRYRAAKFVRRNRTAVALGSLVLIVAVAGMTGILLQARTVRRQRDSALRERDRANRITSFMTDMFKLSNPSEARGNSVSAREILDKASKDIDTGLAKDPELQAQLMSVMGDVFDNLGLYAGAESLLTRAVEVRRHVLGPEHPDTLESMRLLGWVVQEEGHYPEAEKLQRETLESRHRVLGAEHPDTLTSMSDLAMTLQFERRYPEAERLQRETLDIRRRVLGPEHPSTLSSMNNLGAIFQWEGRYAEEEKLLRETFDIERRVLGPDHPLTTATMNNLAWSLRREGHYVEAEKLEREALDVERRVLGPEHPGTLGAKLNLGLILKQEGRYAEAEKLVREALDVERRIFGQKHPETVLTAYNVACVMAVEGKRDEAFSLLREAVDDGLLSRIDVSVMERDSDLISLHSDPRWNAFILGAKQHTAAAKTRN